MAYKHAAKSNKRSHQNNERFYEKRAKTRNFEVNDLVYLYTPVTKSGLRREFRHPWAGPFKVTRKLSELNYEILSLDDKKQVVHINRLKRAYNQSLWRPKAEKKTRTRTNKPFD